MSNLKRTDPVLGELEHDVLWFRKEPMTFLGKEYEVILFVACYSNQDIIPEQQQAYVGFQKHRGRLTKEFEAAALTYYQSVCEEYRDRLGPSADECAPLIQTAAELSGLVVPNSFSIEHTPGKRTINFFFSTSWDPEFDIGIQCVNEEITIVGTHADIL